MATEELMTSKEVSEYIQVNMMTVFKLARTCEIPAVEIDGMWRFEKKQIDEWLEGRLEAIERSAKTCPHESGNQLPPEFTSVKTGARMAAIERKGF